MKESFAGILDRRQPNVVREMLRAWLAWASRSRLASFVRVARTIREHLEDIVAYISWRLTNGVVEGLNNKARLITRRAYGFHSATAVLAMIMLCCTGIDLQPVIKQLSFSPT